MTACPSSWANAETYRIGSNAQNAISGLSGSISTLAHSPVRHLDFLAAIDRQPTYPSHGRIDSAPTTEIPEPVDPVVKIVLDAEEDAEPVVFTF